MNRIFQTLTLLLVATAPATSAEPAPKPVTFDGKIESLGKALGKPDLNDGGLALVTSKGTVYPIANDATSRLLFLDIELQTRTMRLTATPQAGSQTLKVTKVQSLKGAVVYDVDYWCENCQVSYTEPGKCICCGGETVLRERPVK